MKRKSFMQAIYKARHLSTKRTMYAVHLIFYRNLRVLQSKKYGNFMLEMDKNANRNVHFRISNQIKLQMIWNHFFDSGYSK